jgi:NADPH-dependent curcumin reductase CurA
MTEVNQQLRLIAFPEGEAQDSDFQVTEEAVPVPGDGEVLVRNHYVSVDPSTRTSWVDMGSFHQAVKLGDLVNAGTGGEVIASNNPAFIVGDTVAGGPGIQEYSLTDGKMLTKVDTSLAPLTSWMGGLGITGLTAYFGLLDVGKPQPGETVVVTGAAGAVGNVVGQIARIKGARAVGIAGSDDKCKFLTDELGFDGAVNYKDDLYGGLRECTPDRIDIVFDNIGGPMLDTIMRRLAMRSRVIISGATSQYNEPDIYGPKNYLSLASFRAKMEGFIIFDYAKEYQKAREEMAGWMKEGKLIFHENIVDGSVGDFPAVMRQLYAGTNTGKMLLRLPGAR